MWSANRIWLVWPLSHSYRSPSQLQRRISTKSLISVYSREVTVPYLARSITVVSLSAIQAPATPAVSLLIPTRSCTKIAASPIWERLAGANLLRKPSAGTIVGFSSRADGAQRAFSYFKGVMTDLGGDPNLLESAFAISGWQLPVGIESATGGLGAQGVWYFNGRAFRLPSYLLNPPYGTKGRRQRRRSKP